MCKNSLSIEFFIAKWCQFTVFWTTVQYPGCNNERKYDSVFGILIFVQLLNLSFLLRNRNLPCILLT